MRRPDERSRRTISTFPSSSTRDDVNPTLSMFIEDVHLAVMPIGGRTERYPNFSVIIKGEEVERARALHLLGSHKHAYRNNDKEAISDRVNEIAEHLSWQGRALYEIVLSKREVNEYSLYGFTTARLIKVLGFYIQVVPLADYKYIKKRFIILPSKDVFDIAMPPCLGGVSGYRKVLYKLRRFDALGPKFWQRDLEKRKGMPTFDLREYRGLVEAYQSRVTKVWGWNRRDYLLENNTEYYSFHKRIILASAQAQLRKHILGEINKLLQRLMITATIEVNDLPSPEDISKIRNELEAGKMSFTRALDLVSF